MNDFSWRGQELARGPRSRPRRMGAGVYKQQVKAKWPIVTHFQAIGPFLTKCYVPLTKAAAIEARCI